MRVHTLFVAKCKRNSRPLGAQNIAVLPVVSEYFILVPTVSARVGRLLAKLGFDGALATGFGTALAPGGPPGLGGCGGGAAAQEVAPPVLCW